MNIKRIVPQIVMVCAVVGVASAPVVASANDHDGVRYHDRDHGSDTWKGLSIAGGIVGLVGLANHDNTTAAIGFGASLYSAIRAEPSHRVRDWDDRDYRFDRRDDRRDWRQDRREDRRDDRRDGRRDYRHH